MRLWRLGLEKQKGWISLALSAVSFAGCVIFNEYFAPHDKAPLLFLAKAAEFLGFFLLVFGTMLVLFGSKSFPKDSLTDLLWNDRIFMENEIKRRSLLTRKSKLVIFFTDIDGLKKINDTYGHEAGDEAIATTAQCIKNVLRKNDTLYRHGGDEFVAAVAIGKDASEEDILAFEDRIRKSVSNSNFFFENIKIDLSISIGWEIYSPNMDISKVISFADKKMYLEKKAKKNARV